MDKWELNKATHKGTKQWQKQWQKGKYTLQGSHSGVDEVSGLGCELQYCLFVPSFIQYSGLICKGQKAQDPWCWELCAISKHKEPNTEWQSTASYN
jgi:hypothetical protein